MTVVGDLDAVDSVMLFAFDDRPHAVHRTGALVADAGDGIAADGEMSCGHTHNRAAVTGWIVQADDVRHDLSRSKEAFRRIPPTPILLLLYTEAALP